VRIIIYFALAKVLLSSVLIPAVFIKGVIIGLLVSVPLGPIGIMCIQRTLNKGYMSGFISGLGAAAADILFAVIAGFGLSIIINFIEERHIYFQILGGLFVLYIGYRIFSTNPVKQLRLQRLNRTRLSQDFASVFLLTLSNPMAILLFIAIMAGLKVANDLLSIFELSIMVAGIAGGAILWWFVLASIANRFRKKIRLKSIWWLNKITGSVVFLFGLAVIISIWVVR
jgi:threonine/homoserine/homoserine lactone efflux protein